MHHESAPSLGSSRRCLKLFCETFLSFADNLYIYLTLNHKHMKNFLESTITFFTTVFFVISFLVLFHDKPTGSADEPYLAYEEFWSNWGKIILIMWAGSLVTTVVGLAIYKPKK